MEPSYEGFSYAVIVPMLNGWVLLGEVDKFVTLSARRFVKALANSTSLVISVAGVAGETVHVCVVHPGGRRRRAQSCRDTRFDAVPRPAVAKEAVKTIVFTSDE